MNKSKMKRDYKQLMQSGKIKEARSLLGKIQGKTIKQTKKKKIKSKV